MVEHVSEISAATNESEDTDTLSGLAGRNHMKIAVLGAGSIGAYVGGALLSADADVVLIGRARMRERIRRQGLVLTDMQGRRISLDAAQVPYFEDSTSLCDADLILVTVKSADTPEAAQAILKHAPASALVLSLQNGVGNADVLRQVLPGRKVLGGMVPFNIVQTPDGRLHRGTPGELIVEASADIQPWLALFASAHIPLLESDDFSGVQWGKLLVNLNNAVNALSGLPLKTELSQRDYRRCLAMLIDEGRKVLKASNIKPARVLKVGPHIFPTLLRLPDWLFFRLAASALRVDPEARSSMWEDLQAGRKTEVDYLNGAIVKLADSLGITVSANKKIVTLIRAAEAGKQASLTGRELLHALNE